MLQRIKEERERRRSKTHIHNDESRSLTVEHACWGTSYWGVLPKIHELKKKLQLGFFYLHKQVVYVKVQGHLMYVQPRRFHLDLGIIHANMHLDRK